MLGTTLRGLLAHKLRLLLAALAVVLGVAFVTGTFVLGDTINSVFDTLFATTTRNIDVEVRGVSTGTVQGSAVHPPIPASTVDLVRRVPGVEEAFGQIQAVDAAIIGRDGKVASSGGAPSIGVLWDPYPDMTSLILRSGTAPQGGGQVVIDAHTASNQHLKVGDAVRIVLPKGGVRTFTISGVIGFGSQDTLAGATIAAFDPTVGPTLLDSPNEVDTIEVRAQSGVSEATLRSRIAATLPAGIEAVSGGTAAQEASDEVKTAIGFVTTFLLVFAFIALFVGSFIILNTFSILIAQRTRELALLRCLGASRAQVMRSVLLEATITGLIASVVGLGVGLLIALGLEALLGAIGLDLSGSSLQVRARTIIVGLVVGTVVTVVASVVPARRATRVAPVEALRDAEPPVGVISIGRVAVGAGILVAGVAAILLGLFVLSSNQLLATGLGALATFVGVSVLAPIVVVPVVSALGAPVRRLRGVPGQLARENAMRQPRRTASTASALMIGVGLVSCFTVVAASLTSSINQIVDASVTADYIVSPQSTTSQGMPTDVAARIAADPNAGVTSPFDGATFHSGGQAYQAVGFDPPTVSSVADLVVQQGEQLDTLTDDNVAISDTVAKNRNLALGSTIGMQFARPGVHTQKVVTIFAHNPLLGDYLVTRSLIQRTGIETPDAVVLVKAKPGVSQSTLRQDIENDIKDFPDTQVQNNQEYKDAQAKNINTLLNLLTALVVLAIVIALLGVVNTMALSILERVRELGLVRALGMTRGQTRSMVRWETVLITVFGALLGLAVGIGFGIALVRAFASQGVDVLSLAIVQQVTYLIVAFAAGLVAAIWPARRAARVNMLQAIVTE